jgi:hypothetical protein
MKHTSYYFFHTCLFLCVTLTACTAKRSAIKAVSESETASVTESRLTFYRTIDSLSRQFALSFDSAMIWMPEFPTAYTSGMIGCTETPSDSINNSAWPEADKRPSSTSRPNRVRPHAIKVYGLHVTANSDKKSVNNADLKDSVATVTQSQKHKSASKQSSKPSSTPKYIFYILVLVCVLYVIYRLRRR